MEIYCCGCGADVQARLTDGKEIYPHRKDLYSLPFWKCDSCGNYVGCHHKTKDRTRPLGVIATAQVKAARIRIHAMIDPLWKSGRMSRGKIYSKLSDSLGRQYHTGEIRSVSEANMIYESAKQIAAAIGAEHDQA